MIKGVIWIEGRSKDEKGDEMKGGYELGIWEMGGRHGREGFIKRKCMLCI